MNDLVKLIQDYIPNQKTAVALAEALLDEGFIAKKPMNTDVDRIVTAFKKSYGTTKVSRYDRYAAKRLLERYSVDDVIGIIKITASFQGHKYCPVVGSVVQLEQKWVNIKRFMQTMAEKEDMEI